MARVPIMKDVLGKIRSGKNLKDLLQAVEFSDELTRTIQDPSMDPETLSSILLSMATKGAQEARRPCQLFCGFPSRAQLGR